MVAFNKLGCYLSHYNKEPVKTKPRTINEDRYYLATGLEYAKPVSVLCVHVCMHMSLCLSVCLSMYACVYVCVFVYVYACVYVYLCVCMSVCVCVHVCDIIPVHGQIKGKTRAITRYA